MVDRLRSRLFAWAGITIPDLDEEGLLRWLEEIASPSEAQASSGADGLGALGSRPVR